MHKKKSDKLIILGTFTNWINAPFDDESFEIWGCNTLWGDINWDLKGRADLWWEIHTLHTRHTAQKQWLARNRTMPVMMQKHHKDIPMSIKFPLDEVVEYFGGRRYFLCTFAYEVAYAIYMGYKEIHFYGVNMMYGDDYIQKWNMEYWLGRAEQSGIKIVIPEDCDLLQSPKIYGYEADNTIGVYMQRYINQMDITNRRYLADIMGKLQIVFQNLNLVTAEQTKFMLEIFNRYGIRPEQDGEYGEIINMFYKKTKEPDDN